MMDIRKQDALELLRSLPAGGVDLVLTDPPYNIKKAEWVGHNTSKLHICRKPVALLRRLIRVHTNKGELVCDPFAGSTAEACALEGRNFIGGDINAEYCKIARAQVAAITPTFSQL